MNRIVIKGKEYPVSIIDDVPHINGVTVKEFLNSLTPEEIMDLSFNGGEAIIDIENEEELN